MSDQDPDQPTVEEREVSRLLAEQGRPLATPADVVARLDDALAGLQAERGRPLPDPEQADPGQPDPDQLEPQRPRAGPERRRSRWPAALLAAAAIVVGGFALGSSVDLTSGGEDSLATSGDSGADAGAGAGSSGEPEAAAEDTFTLPPVSADTAVRDVRAALRRTALSNPDRLSVDAPPGTLRKAARCGVVEGSRLRLVRYDGMVATLALRRADGVRTATIRSCRGGEVLATVPLD